MNKRAFDQAEDAQEKVLHSRPTQTKIHELISRSESVIALDPLTPVVLVKDLNVQASNANEDNALEVVPQDPLPNFRVHFHSLGRLGARSLANSAKSMIYLPKVRLAPTR